ncbi:MAG: tyrosine-type recombinase/integrase [Actinomycetota bacterium]|nr:tyrosine-type recombinase/integrase [Actinomycetota bacterium]
MSVLSDHAARYVALRAALGYQPGGTARLVRSLVDHVEAAGDDHLAVEVTVSWAHMAVSDSQVAVRLSFARRFGAYLSALDPAHEIPPPALRPPDSYRTPPHIYSEEEIAALLAAAGKLSPGLWASSVATLIGLAAACGIRPAEAYRLCCCDVDLDGGRLAVMRSKGGRSRLLPLHATTTAALTAHLKVRRRARIDHDRLFVTATGRPLTSAVFAPTFRCLLADASIVTAAGRRPARLGDLRHSFAVATLTGWHRDGIDVQQNLPVLSAYLGHLRPASTFWYLEAVPELMAIVGQRVADAWEAGS